MKLFQICRFKWWLILCCAVLAACEMTMLSRAEETKKLSDIVAFTGIVLCYIDDNGMPEEEMVQDGALIEFENGEELLFGYAELERTEAKAKVERGATCGIKLLSGRSTIRPGRIPARKRGLHRIRLLSCLTGSMMPCTVMWRGVSG